MKRAVTEYIHPQIKTAKYGSFIQTLTLMMVCLRTNISKHNKLTLHADHYIIY